MSRIRSIHPGIASDEAYMSMSMTCKAAWPLLWTECDDNGVFEWKPIVLKARIFPADNVDFSEVLAELSALGCVQQFDMDGKHYGLVRNFGHYQRPKNPSYRHPLPPSLRKFGGFKSDEPDNAPPVLPQSSPSPPEKAPQMKEERGNRKDTPLAQQPLAAAPRDATDKLFEAAGIRGNPHPSMAFPGEILGLVDGGYDMDRDILPAIRAKPNPNARTWGYFLPQIHDFVRRRRDSASAARSAPPPATIDWAGRMTVFNENGTWSPPWGPKPGERGCMVPAEHLREHAA